MTTPAFSISPEVRALGATATVFLLNGMQPVAVPAFEAEWLQAVAAVRDGLSREAIAADPVLQGFRALHAAVGVSNKRYPAAPEALLSLLLETGRLPRIHPLVDCYNLISVQTRLSLGAHDADRLAWPVALRLTDGTETFFPMGAVDPKPVRAGEYAYIDAAGILLCRLEARQCDATKITPATRNALVILQGNAATPPDLLYDARLRLISLLQRACGGEVELLWAP